MKINEIAFVGYPVTDLKRARAFYEGVLGLEISHSFGDVETEAWIEYDIAAGTLAIANGAPDWKPSAGGGSAAFEVEDFDVAMEDLEAAGARILTGPFDSPVCRMAVISDPDGNSIVIHKRKGQ